MDFTGETRKSSIWSQYTFRYAQTLLRTGHHQYQKQSGSVLYDAQDEPNAELLHRRLDSEWQKETRAHQRGGRASFLNALVRTFWKQFMFTGFFVFMQDASRMGLAVLFGQLLESLSEQTITSRSRVWYCGMGVCITVVVQAVYGPQIVQRFCVSVYRWHSATMSMIYSKVLRMPRTDMSIGHVVDMTTSDAYKYLDVIWHIHSIWLGPLEAAFAFWYMYRQVGIVISAGYLVVILLVPVHTYLAKLFSNVSKQKVEATDKRVQFVSEIITAISTIKMYCWEKPFGHMLAKLRKTELSYLWCKRLYGSGQGELNTYNYRIVATAIVLTAVYFGYGLEAAKIFPMFALFNVVNNSLLNFLSWGLKTFFELGVSLKRIEAFLLSDEGEGAVVGQTDRDDTALILDNVQAQWKDKSVTLKNLRLRIRRGELVAVVGSVGSGKSSLLQLLLGELRRTRGEIGISGTLSYAAQQAWIYSDTIRENITFDSPYNSMRLQEVLEITALDHDLGIFNRGEETLVGGSGVTLSGGQRSRVGLARAVYHNADIYLLDDPLSAVDAAVGRHIFDKCMKKFLKTKTRILVTHQLQYLNEVDRIIIMDKGEIIRQGTYDELTRSNTDLGLYVTKSELKESTDDQSEKVKEKQQLPDTSEVESDEDDEYQGSSSSWSTLYKYYFMSGLTKSRIILVIFLNVLCQLTYNGTDWWLVIWIKRVSEDPGLDTRFYVTTFIILTILVYLVGVLRTAVFFRSTITLSTTLHDAMYHAVIRSPMKFFHSTLSGRILNRFSADLYALDNEVPERLYEMIQQFLILIGTLCVTFYLRPVLVLPAGVLTYMLYRTRTVYVAGVYGFAQLEAKALSPLLTHLKSTMEGVETIRSLQRQRAWLSRYHQLCDTLASRRWASLSIYNWCSFRSNMTMAIFTIFAVLTNIMSAQYMDHTIMAMSLAYLVPMMELLNEVGRLSTELERQAVQVGRILDYINLPSEAPLQRSGALNPLLSEGDIVMENVGLKYEPGGEDVLTDISMKIKHGDKVGIVGRTGAGKSSLIQVLFRMYEPQGRVYIAGIDTYLLGLHELRGQMSIIPQDPVLFSGSIRMNLDPFEKYSDLEIWQALGEVQLEQLVRSLPGALDSNVLEGGLNISVGERQLFCLCRAILRRSRILVMDEATANVDSKTDKLIREAIRNTFSQCTVIIIAHRLNSVMDCDKIMVLSRGRIVEFDKPEILLKYQDGALVKLLKETGHIIDTTQQ